MQVAVASMKHVYHAQAMLLSSKKKGWVRMRVPASPAIAARLQPIGARLDSRPDELVAEHRVIQDLSPLASLKASQASEHGSALA